MLDSPHLAPDTALEPFTDLDSTVLGAYDPDAGTLRGSQCAQCGRQVFPAAQVCFVCRGVDLREVLLPPAGELYTFTWVHPGRDKAPYGLGYVDLEHDVRVLARLAGDRDSLQCGARVRVAPDADGAWCFRPEDTGDTGDSDGSAGTTGTTIQMQDGGQR